MSGEVIVWHIVAATCSLLNMLCITERFPYSESLNVFPLNIDINFKFHTVCLLVCISGSDGHIYTGEARGNNIVNGRTSTQQYCYGLASPAG